MPESPVSEAGCDLQDLVYQIYRQMQLRRGPPPLQAADPPFLKAVKENTSGFLLETIFDNTINTVAKPNIINIFVIKGLSVSKLNSSKVFNASFVLI